MQTSNICLCFLATQQFYEIRKGVLIKIHASTDMLQSSDCQEDKQVRYADGFQCRLLTAKSQSVRGASRQPAFMGSCLAICQTCLPCPPSGWVSHCFPCSLMIGLIVVLLAFFWVWYGFSTVVVGLILWNGCGIQGQNFLELLQENEMPAGCHCRNWI